MPHAHRTTYYVKCPVCNSPGFPAVFSCNFLSPHPMSSTRDALLLSAGAAAGGVLAYCLLGGSARPRAPRGRTKLEYFDIKGVGEKVRLAFALNGIEFDDVRVGRKAWPDRKASARYGQLPIMTLPDGTEVYQSDAMLRYVGAMGDGSLYPQDAERRLEIDSALGVLGDLSRSWRPCLSVGFSPQNHGHAADLDPDAKKAILKRIREAWLAKELPKYMGFLSDLIERSGGPFLCGSVLTIADLQALSQLGYYSRGVADFVPRTALDAYPKIKSYIASVKAEPRVARYYASK